MRIEGLIAGCLLVTASLAVGHEQPQRADFRQIAKASLAEQGKSSVDLLSQKNIKPVLSALSKGGFVVTDEKKLIDAVLPDSHFLVRIAGTVRGKRYMDKVASFGLIYDRLDRIASEPGGEAMLRDLVRLPDGEKYSRISTPRGVPGLLDLLPKRRSGKTRTVKSYREPTGRIYTQKDLLQRLKVRQAKPAKPR